ncbi:MAG TPA: DJ-1/PfpI family protein [Micavibrio sp.]
MSVTKVLSGSKIAILVANGCAEQDMTEAQRALIEAGATTKIISPNAGLVNGWAGDHWGHHYAVDVTLSTALSADFDMLVVPGGQRSLDKLMLTAHTKRFVNGFLLAEKPVVMYGDALHLLITTDNVRNRTVMGPETMKDVVVQAGGTWAETNPVIDATLMTGATEDEGRKNLIAAMVEFFGEYATMRRNAAEAVAA